MKPLLALLLSLAIFGCESALAKPALLVGLSAGGALTDIRSKWSEDAPQKFKSGLIAGGQAELILDSAPVLPHAALRVEAMYSQKGYKDQVMQVDEEGHNLGWKTYGTLHADEVVIAAFYVARFRLPGVVPFVELGPEAGLPLHAKETVDHNPYNDAPSSFYPSYWSKKTNWGINVGVGAALPLSGGELAARVRYNYGLTNLLRYGGSLYPSTKIFTKGIEVMLGYGFRLSAL